MGVECIAFIVIEISEIGFHVVDWIPLHGWIDGVIYINIYMD